MLIRDRIKELRRVKASELRPSPHNWREHPPAQQDALRGVLAEIGFADALLAREVDGHLELIDGHCRAEITPDMEVPVLVLDLDEDEARKLLLTLDPLAAMAEANKDALGRLLHDIETENPALQEMLDGLAKDNAIDLFEPAAEEAPEPELDRAAELQKKWKTKPGQLWVIPGKTGEHRLLCGDSTKGEDVGRVMGGARAGLMNTDPPYGVKQDVQANYDAANETDGTNRRNHFASIENDELTGEELQTFLESVIRAAVPALIERPAFYLWHPMLTQGTFFAAAAAAADILIHRQIIWAKPHFIFGRGDYHWQHELCFYGWIKGKRCPFYGERNQSSVWNVSIGHRKDHPTEKPVELFTTPIRNHLKPGEIAYEPFAGSGPQFVAAEQLGRICYGIEIEPKYVAVALQRLADMGLSPKLEATP